MIKGKAKLEVLARSEGERANESGWYEPGKPIRGWREASTPYENLLTSLLAMDGRPTDRADLAVLGMFCGGVDLPILAAVAADAKGSDCGRTASCGTAVTGRPQPDGNNCDLSRHR